MASLPTRGIDISEFNGDVNLAALKGQIDFVIIRCGYGGNYTNQDDTEYETNVRKCVAAGIPYGVYLYSYAVTTDMARSEAAHALRLLRGKKPLYGVWYDVEDNTLPSGEAIVENCITFCEEIERAGYYCGIYSFLNWMETRLSSPRLDRFDKWVAQWSSHLDYDKPFGMWQYTSSGVLNGQRFDMDYAFKDYPAIIGGEDLTKEEVRALAQQVYDENERKYHTIDSVPQWAREAVRDVYRVLDLGGVGGAQAEVVLNASQTYVRAVYLVSKLLDHYLPGWNSSSPEAAEAGQTEERTAQPKAQEEPEEKRAPEAGTEPEQEAEPEAETETEIEAEVEAEAEAKELE